MRQVLVGALMMAIATMASAQKRPAAPPTFCVGANCVSSAPVSGSSNVVKWNPGHYVQANMLGFPDTEGARRDIYSRIKDNPNFKGALMQVTWGMLEPKKGVYDFSQIDRELAYLKSINKRLILEVWWMQFGGAVEYAGKSGNRYFPDYILQEGGVFTHHEVETHCVKVDNAYWMDRLVALYKALAERYNNEPYFEQLIITEMACTSVKEFMRTLPTIAQAWPNTSVIMYANWVDSPEMARDLLALGAKYGVGVGGPDTIPPRPISPYGEDHGSQALLGVGVRPVYYGSDSQGDFGTIDYRGKIPVSNSYEALQDMKPADLIDYILNTLRSTHMAWGVDDGQSQGLDWYSGVLPVVTAVNGKINTACPTAYQNRCGQLK